MLAPANTVRSNQISSHEDLFKTLDRHLNHPYLKPISEHTDTAFRRLENQFKTPFILDTGCGTGESTRYLADNKSDLVLGLDKSMIRLGKHERAAQENYLLERVDLIDFWRILHQKKCFPKAQYLLYPNPWPKKNHLKRRWHGHPVFPYLLDLGGYIELRTNWDVYAKEFAQAIEYCTGQKARLEEYQPEIPITLFERKYHLSGQALWKLHITLSSGCVSSNYPGFALPAFPESSH